MAQRLRTDWTLFITTVPMVCFGLVIVYSASSIMAELKFGSSSHFFVRQLGWAVISFFALMYLKRRRLSLATESGVGFRFAGNRARRCLCSCTFWTLATTAGSALVRSRSSLRSSPNRRSRFSLRTSSTGAPPCDQQSLHAVAGLRRDRHPGADGGRRRISVPRWFWC